MGSSVSFVENKWMHEVNKKITNWIEWSGDLKIYIINPSRKLFQSIIKEYSIEYEGKTKEGLKLLQKL